MTPSAQAQRFGSDSAPALEARPVGRLFSLLSIAIAVGVLGVAVLAGLDDRREAWERAEATLDNASRTAAYDLDQMIRQVDQALQGTERRLAIPELDHVSASTRQDLLFAHDAQLSYIAAVLVLGQSGDVLYDSRSSDARLDRVDDRDYFRAQRDGTAPPGLYISAPFEAAAEHAGRVVALSRRLSGMDGRFAGVVVALLPLTHLGELLNCPPLERGGAAFLATEAGILLMRVPDGLAYAGRDVANEPDFSAMSGREEGSFTGKSMFDGVDRLYSFQRVGSWPLIVSVGLGIDELLAPFIRKMFIFAPLTLLLCLALLLLSGLLRRELKRRTQAESMLATLARTDALTGLPNRRAFDDFLDTEWRNGQRVSLPLALLFIDVDDFKSINSRYGHHAGDRALQAIAEAIRTTVRRPRDRAFRIGGEEFTVVLPETDQDGALHVAKRLSETIRGIALPDVAGPMTVSIGLACEVPDTGCEHEVFVDTADAALHAAKKRGKDRVEIAARSWLRISPA